MFTKRIIPCLDVNGGRVVKGVNFVDLKDAGDPVEIAKAYDEAGADELVFLDITASSDARQTVVDMVRKVAECVFIPFTVGGGIRTVEDFRALLREGADKISINSSAINTPGLIQDAAEKFGSQCVVRGDRREETGGRKRLEYIQERRKNRCGDRRGRVGPESREPGRRGDTADKYGLRRHESRVRLRADSRYRRSSVYPCDCLRRRGKA